MRKVLGLPVVISWEEDVYIARCPLIQGAFAEGETPEEALKELSEVIKMILAYRAERQLGSEIFEELEIGPEKMCTTLPISLPDEQAEAAQI